MIKIPLFIIFLLLLPAIVIGECTCDAEEEEDSHKSKALKYKIGAIASILVAGGIGVWIPIIGNFFVALKPEKNVFFLIKAFAAGVILSTAYIHVLPDAFESLTSPCLKEHPWGQFPFTGFVAVLSSIGTLMIDAFATSYYTKRSKQSSAVILDEEKVTDNDGHVHVHAHTHGHFHRDNDGLVHAHTPSHSCGAMMLDNSDPPELLRHRVISQVLELGIVVHSVIIGISLGTSQSPQTIRPLLAALTFHQFFEGMGLGGCITQAKFKERAIVIMTLFFSLTTPVGIGIGIGISNVYKENSATALIVQGVFNAASAGILIYMALVDILAVDFMNPKVQSNGILQFGVNIFLLLGVASMSILAKWA